MKKTLHKVKIKSLFSVTATILSLILILQLPITSFAAESDELYGSDYGEGYLFNDTYQFYIADKIDGALSAYVDFSKRRAKTLSSDMIYYVSDTAKPSQEDRDAIAAAEVMLDVCRWYDSEFNYQGLDGKRGLFPLVVSDQYGLGVCEGALGIYISPEVSKGPEVLVHEFGHAFSRNRSEVPDEELKGQANALSEAVSDILSAMYLCDKGDSSWNLAKATSSPKNIPKLIRTMDDYKYDPYYCNTEVKGIKRNILKYTELTIGAGKYIYALITGKDVNSMNYAIFTADRGSSDSVSSAHENSYIVSGCVYRIWKEALNEDTELLKQIMNAALQYMAPAGDFGDFRDAFMKAIRLYCSYDETAYVSTFFDVAGISGKNMKTVVERELILPTEEETADPSIEDETSGSPVEDETSGSPIEEETTAASAGDDDTQTGSRFGDRYSLYELYNMSFSELCEIDWEEGELQLLGDMSSYLLLAYMDDAHYEFMYCEDDLVSGVILASISGAGGSLIYGDRSNGIYLEQTMAEVRAWSDPNPDVYSSSVKFSFSSNGTATYSPVNGTMITLYFNGESDDSPIYGAKIVYFE